MKLLIIYMGNPKDENELRELRGIKYCNPNNVFSEVHILMPNASNLCQKPSPLLLNYNIYLYFFKRWPLISNLIFVSVFIKALKITKEQRINVIRAYNPHLCGLVGVLVQKLTGIPCVVSVHSDLRTLFQLAGVKYLFKCKLLTKLIERFCFNNARLIFIQAEHMRKYIKERYNIPDEKFYQIKIMVDIPKNIVHRPDPRYFTIIFVGRLGVEKNPLCLLRTFKILKLKIPQARLWIVGDGQLRTTLENKVKSDNLNDVCFYGHVGRDMVFKLLFQSDVFVHPGGKSEGFSNTILEAQAVGLPVLISDAFYKDGCISKNGLPVFKYNDEHECAGMLCHIFSDNALTKKLKEKNLSSFSSYSKDSPLKVEELAYLKVAA